MRFRNFWLVTGLSLLALSGLAYADLRPFSLYGLAGWDKQTFFRVKPTIYTSVEDGRAQVIKAECNESSSGYIWQQEIDLNATPILHWRWKVDQIFEGLNEREKAGDDFPARVYVVKRGGWAFWSSHAIAYVWSNGQQGQDDWPSGYTSNIHVVPVRAGTEGVGEWQDEKRDLRADFKKYFDIETDTLSGIAIMSDCDNHKGRGTAWFGDLNLSAE